MTKVCLLSTIHSPFDGRIFHKQAKSLVAAGYEVVIVAPHEKDEAVDGIKIKAVPAGRGNLRRTLLTAFRVFIAGLREKADIYHFHYPELIPAGLFLRLMGRKVIYDVREYYKLKFESRSEIPHSLRSLAGWTYDRFENGAARFFNGVVAVDRVIADKFNGRAIRVTNYPYLPEEADQAPSRPDDGIFRCVYAGGLVGMRGLFKMIEAMEYVDDRVRLVLAGPFYWSRDKERAEALKGYEKVEFLGLLPWPEVVRILPGFDLGLLLLQPTQAYLTQGEGTIKLFEYMMSGIPVLGSNFPNFERIIGEAGCGITVDPTDPKEIARKINEVMADPVAARRMGENGRKAFRAQYNWPKESEKMLALYRKILGEA